MKPQFNKEYFADKRFNRGRTPTFYDKVYSKLIKRKFETGSKILEIGCSHGWLLKNLEDKFETYGLDISEYAITQARKNCKKTKFFISDANKLPKQIAKKKFDVIFALDLFEHLKRPEKLAKTCFNLLNNKGILIVKVPNKKSITLTVLKLLNKEEKWKCYHDESHYSVLELHKWKKLFENIRFKVKVKPSPPTTFLKKLFSFSPRLFFNKLNLVIFNQTISLFCRKNHAIENIF